MARKTDWMLRAMSCQDEFAMIECGIERMPNPPMAAAMSTTLSIASWAGKAAVVAAVLRAKRALAKSRAKEDK